MRRVAHQILQWVDAPMALKCAVISLSVPSMNLRPILEMPLPIANAARSQHVCPPSLRSYLQQQPQIECAAPSSNPCDYTPLNIKHDLRLTLLDLFSFNFWLMISFCLWSNVRKFDFQNNSLLAKQHCMITSIQVFSWDSASKRPA